MSFLLSCAKSSPAPSSGPIGYQKLAGRKTFVITCRSYNPYSNQTSGVSTSNISDSIIVISASKIYLCNERDTLVYSNTNGGYTMYEWGFGDSHISISYPQGSDTIYYCYSEKGESCGGYSTNTIPRTNPYYIIVPCYVHFGESVTFQTNAPASATFSWSFGDGATSTVASPTHTYNSNTTFLLLTYYVTATITINDTPYICNASLNATSDPQIFSGVKTWTKSMTIRNQLTFHDTTYNLYDTAFPIVIHPIDSVFVWGRYFAFCSGGYTYTSNGLRFCDFQNYTLCYSSNAITTRLALSSSYAIGDSTYIINYLAH